MTRSEAWFSHAATVLVGATGLVYGWMRYFAEPADEFAVVNHPWQPDLQGLHILFAPLVVFAGGLVWRKHVWARFRSGYRGRRRTGLFLMTLFVPMGLSGYALQAASDEAWREVWIVLHVATSVGWILGYAMHQLTRATPATTEASAPLRASERSTRSAAATR